MKTSVLSAIALLTLAPAAHAQQQGPGSIAAAVLNGYVRQDITLIAPFSNDTNARFFADLLAGRENPSALFDGTRGAAGTGWDGKTLPARYDEQGHAIVPFAIEGPGGPVSLGSGVQGRYMAIVLTLDSPQDTSWGFEDINYIARADYAAMRPAR